MKKYLFFALAALTLSFIACDQVSEADRLIEIEGATVNRAVLIADFSKFCQIFMDVRAVFKVMDASDNRQKTDSVWKSFFL